MAKPILKWAGGKRQLLSGVINRFPSDFHERSYHEPMVGAGAVVFHIEPKSGSINDVNPRLVNFYRAVKSKADELIELNKKHEHNKEYFEQARRRFNSNVKGDVLDPVEDASLLLYLNRTCFNGLYRENRKGEFNVPYGRYKTVDFFQEKAIREASAILQKLDIFEGDFDYILTNVRPGDVVYFDPPYHPISATSSFTAYSKVGFGLPEQKRLKETILKLDAMGVFVVLSNSYSPIIESLYINEPHLKVEKIAAKRAINCDGSKRGEISELIVYNSDHINGT